MHKAFEPRKKTIGKKPNPILRFRPKILINFLSSSVLRRYEMSGPLWWNSIHEAPVGWPEILVFDLFAIKISLTQLCAWLHPRGIL